MKAMKEHAPLSLRLDMTSSGSSIVDNDLKNMCDALKKEKENVEKETTCTYSRLNSEKTRN